MWQCWHAVRLSLFSPLVRIHLKKITKTIAKQTSIRKYIIKYIFCFSCWIFCLLKKCQPAVAGEEFRHLKIFQWFPQECLCPSAANVEDLTTLNGDRWQSHCLFSHLVASPTTSCYRSTILASGLQMELEIKPRL